MSKNLTVRTLFSPWETTITLLSITSVMDSRVIVVESRLSQRSDSDLSQLYIYGTLEVML